MSDVADPEPGWLAVSAATMPEAGEVRALELDDGRWAVWRGASGVVSVCEARCPHQWSDLVDEGRVVNDELVCLAHGWRFDAHGCGSKVDVRGRRHPKSPVRTRPLRARHDGFWEVGPAR